MTQCYAACTISTSRQKGGNWETVSGRKAVPKWKAAYSRVRFRNTSFTAHTVGSIHSRLYGSDRDVSDDGTMRIDGLVDGG